MLLNIVMASKNKKWGWLITLAALCCSVRGKEAQRNAPNLSIHPTNGSMTCRSSEVWYKIAPQNVSKYDYQWANDMSLWTYFGETKFFRLTESQCNNFLQNTSLLEIHISYEQTFCNDIFNYKLSAQLDGIHNTAVHVEFSLSFKERETHFGQVNVSVSHPMTLVPVLNPYEIFASTFAIKLNTGNMSSVCADSEGKNQSFTVSTQVLLGRDLPWIVKSLQVSVSQKNRDEDAKMFLNNTFLRSFLKNKKREEESELKWVRGAPCPCFPLFQNQYYSKQPNVTGAKNNNRQVNLACLIAWTKVNGRLPQECIESVKEIYVPQPTLEYDEDCLELSKLEYEHNQTFPTTSAPLVPSDKPSYHCLSNCSLHVIPIPNDMLISLPEKNYLDLIFLNRFQENVTVHAVLLLAELQLSIDENSTSTNPPFEIVLEGLIWNGIVYFMPDFTRMISQFPLNAAPMFHAAINFAKVGRAIGSLTNFLTVVASNYHFPRIEMTSNELWNGVPNINYPDELMISKFTDPTLSISLRHFRLFNSSSLSFKLGLHIKYDDILGIINHLGYPSSLVTSCKLFDISKLEDYPAVCGRCFRSKYTGKHHEVYCSECWGMDTFFQLRVANVAPPIDSRADAEHSAARAQETRSLHEASIVSLQSSSTRLALSRGHKLSLATFYLRTGSSRHSEKVSSFKTSDKNEQPFYRVKKLSYFAPYESGSVGTEPWRIYLQDVVLLPSTDQDAYGDLSYDDLNNLGVICKYKYLYSEFTVASEINDNLKSGNWSSTYVMSTQLTKHLASIEFMATTVPAEENPYFNSSSGYYENYFLVEYDAMLHLFHKSDEYPSNCQDDQWTRSADKLALFDVSQTGKSVLWNNDKSRGKRHVGCLHFLLNKWFVFAQHEDGIYLSYSDRQRGENRPLDEIAWIKLWRPYHNPAAIKCPALNNFLIWSEIQSDEIVHLYLLDLSNEGSLPKELSHKSLCSCSKSKIVNIAEIDIVYPDIENAFELNLIVSCTDAICSSSIIDQETIRQSERIIQVSDLMQTNEKFILFQIDQTYIYYIKNSSPYIYIKEILNRTDEIVLNTFPVSQDVDVGMMDANPRSTSGLYQEIKYNWVYVYKEVEKLPIPPLYCIAQLSHKNVRVFMTNATTVLVELVDLWNKFPECKRFAQPHKIIEIKYGIIPNLSEAIDPAKSVCNDEPETKFAGADSYLINCISVLNKPTGSDRVEIALANVQKKKWYFFQTKLFPNLEQKVLKLWYSDQSGAPVKLLHFTKFVPQEIRNTTRTIAIISSVGGVFLLLALLFGWIAWRNRRYNLKIPHRLLRMLASEIKLKEKLGEGHFGEVRKAIWRRQKSGKVHIVVKMLNDRATEKDHRRFCEEAIVVSKLHSPWIVKSVGICLQSNHVMLAFEYINGGSLEAYLRNTNVQRQVTAADLYRLLCDALEACIYLEKEGFIHRDIAARNCLVELHRGGNTIRPKKLKLADFGLAKDIGNTVSYGNDEDELPIHWTAPEAMRGNGKSDHKSDIWSFGVLAWEMYTWAAHPYGPCKIPANLHTAPCPKSEISSVNKLVRKICGWERYNLLLHPDPCTANLTEEFKNDFLTSCWNFQPENRPGFENLKQILSKQSDFLKQITLDLVPLPFSHYDPEDDANTNEGAGQSTGQTVEGFYTDVSAVGFSPFFNPAYEQGESHAMGSLE